MISYPRHASPARVGPNDLRPRVMFASNMHTDVASGQANAHLPLRAIVLGILVIDAALIAANAGMNQGLRWPFEVMDFQLDLKDEGNLASWWSSAQLLVAALLALWLGWSGGEVRSTRRWVWSAVAIGLAALSADESAGLHEWIGLRYADRVHGNIEPTGEMDGVYSWLVVLWPILALGAVGLAWFAWRELRRPRRALAMALVAVCCWVGVVAAEFVEGRWLYMQNGAQRGHQATIEEGLELLGTAMFILAFVQVAEHRSSTAAMTNQAAVQSPHVRSPARHAAGQPLAQ